MHQVAFLQDLAVVMIVAGLVTVIFHRLKQPVVLGYIIAGVIIGPYTPPFPLIHDEQTINTLAELGVIFLMFSLGLEFSFRKLKKVGVTALIAATLEILLMVWVGYEVGQLFRWSRMDSIFLGAMLSISSTTIIVKALGELGKAKESFAQLIFGILIVEDILAIVMIALLSGIAMTGSLNAGQVLATVGKLGIFLVVALVAGLLTVPRLLGYVARFKSNEMLLVAVLGLCFGMALLAVKLGYSVALGAFVIGAVIAETRQIGKIEHLMEPIRDMFSAVFFVAIGLLIQPMLLVKYAVPILVITLAVVIGKVVTCGFGAFMSGNDRSTSLRVGMGLAQIGEFSFIIASLGLTLKVTSDFLYPIAVTVSAITTLLTPYLIKSTDAVVRSFDQHAPSAMTTWLDIYTRWVGQLGSRSTPGAGRFLRKWSWQVALNLLLAAAIFLCALYVRENKPSWLQKTGISPRWLDASLWGAALIAAMPLLIASYRKLQAIALLVAEASTERIEKATTRGAVRNIIASSVSIAGVVVMAAAILLLSATLLPSVEALVVLLLIVAALTVIFRRSFIRIHSQAQVSLRDTLEPAPAMTPEPEGPDHSLARLVGNAQLLTVKVPAGSPAAGQLIRELRLRTETGASIVGIERNGVSMVNPGPDDELMAGDQVLLIGRSEQLLKAKEAIEAQIHA